MNKIKNFYDRVQFPGTYEISQLKNIKNRYLLTIDIAMSNVSSVLDVGCGTGLIANLFAFRYPDVEFTAIDFARSIEFGKKFASNNQIKNVNFVRQDFLEFNTSQKYDVVICQGVLHHIPNRVDALAKLKQLTNKTLVLGIYHPWGKWAKKWFNINYQNEILRQDQEEHPYETAFTCQQVIDMLPEFELRCSYPTNINILSHLNSLFNYRNGGLITYVFRRIND